jgi:hypothetical protein
VKNDNEMKTLRVDRIHPPPEPPADEPSKPERCDPNCDACKAARGDVNYP